MTREELINHIKYDLEIGADITLTNKDAEKIIKALEQEPKTGYWITKEAYSEDKAMGFTEQIVCSSCDMQNSYFSEWDECKNPISKTFIRSKYCPNCGAKMESEDKE